VADFINPLIAAASGLGGVFLGGWLSGRREKSKRRIDFVTLQLSEFYGPLVSLRAEIDARSRLRLKLEGAMDQAHMDGLLDAGRDAQRAEDVTDMAIPSMLMVMRDEDRIFKEVSMPLYRKMLDIFREKTWLAEPETRAFLPPLIEFVDVWERHILGTMPGELISEINHTERNLHPFYDHLVATHDRLRGIIAS
jgi:hypothetical protein